MIFAKIVNNTVEIAPVSGWLADGRSVSNYNLLPDDVLRAEGWKPLVEVKPEYNPETHYLEQDAVADNRGNITITYKAVVIPPDLMQLKEAELIAVKAELVTVKAENAELKRAKPIDEPIGVKKK